MPVRLEPSKRGGEPHRDRLDTNGGTAGGSRAEKEDKLAQLTTNRLGASLLANWWCRAIRITTVCGGCSTARPIKRIEIDAARGRALVQVGVTWRELDAATQRLGLAVTGGRVSSNSLHAS